MTSSLRRNRPITAPNTSERATAHKDGARHTPCAVRHSSRHTPCAVRGAAKNAAITRSAIAFSLALFSFAAAAHAQPNAPQPQRIVPKFRHFEPAPVLRWQDPDVNAAYSRYGVHPVEYQGEGAGAVQHAVQFAPTNPLDDPFGDRLAQENGAGQPAPAAPPDLAPLPEGPMLDFNQPQAVPSPSNGLPGAGQSSLPCDRIYNDRNCCDEEAACARIRDYLRRMRISDISVDITPAFRPETGAFYYGTEALEANGQPQGVEDNRVGQLALAGPRTWRNQQGQVIAEGRWTDYRYGRVYVSQGDGQVVQIPVHELSDDDLCFVNAWWNLPSECTLGTDPYLGRSFVQTTFTWKASALCHKPLYFEELQLERYGHTAGPIVQPFLSGAHFFGSIAVLPYSMGVQLPNECIYQLGLYRPGSCAPWLVDPVPISLRGALFQTGAVLGGVYLIP